MLGTWVFGWYGAKKTASAGAYLRKEIFYPAGCPERPSSSRYRRVTRSNFTEVNMLHHGHGVQPARRGLGRSDV